MALLSALAAIGLFAAGAAAGIIGLTSAAIRREEKNFTLTRQATGPVIQAGRWVNGVGVRDLRTGRDDRLDQRQRHSCTGHSRRWLWRGRPLRRAAHAHLAGRDPDAR
jgi:hypothetical protein